jgi:hypothetical protein
MNHNNILKKLNTYKIIKNKNYFTKRKIKNKKTQEGY